MKNNFILIISGVGGAGKGSVMQVLRDAPERFIPIISFTDRPIRQGEIDGMPYHFVSKSEFDLAIAANEFIEWETVRGKYRYGKKKADLDSAISSQRIPYMEIEVLGAEKFRKMKYDTVSVFIDTPSLEEAKKRLLRRGTDSPKQLQVRIDRFDFELSFKDKYDYIIVNDDLKRAQDELLEIIQKEQSKHSTGKTS